MDTVPGTVRSTVTTLAIDMRFDRENRKRILELLLSAARPTLSKRGCRSCRVEKDALDPERLRYNEEWDSGEALRRHARSDEFLWVLVALDLCSEEPSVTVGERTDRQGMEVLRELREG